MNSKGNTALLLIISVMSVGLIVYLVSLVEPILKYKEQVSRDVTREHLTVAMMNLKTNLENRQVLEKSANLPENSAIRCVSTNTCTATDTFSPFKLVNIEGNTIADGASAGMTARGDECVAESTKPECIIVFSVSWRPMCPEDGSACVNPNIEFQGTAFFSEFAGVTFPINMDRMGFKTIAIDVNSLLK